MPFQPIVQRSPLGGGGVSQEISSASHEDRMSYSDVDTDMEDLEKSKTCDAGCCDHSRGCQCGGCFCQVRTDIQINENQTTYSGQGGHGVPIAYGELSTEANNASGVAALGARLASLTTDASSSLPIDIAPHRLRPDSLVARPFDALRERDAHQSYEEHMRVNVQRLGIHVDVETNSDFDDNPGDHSRTPRSDCDLIFDFESNEVSRSNSHDLPPNMLSLQGRTHSPHVSGRNTSIAVQGAGGLFDTMPTANRSQYSLDMPVCFGPLQLVPECRHSRAADCA